MIKQVPPKRRNFLENSRGCKPDGTILLVEIAAVDIASRDAYEY